MMSKKRIITYVSDEFYKKIEKISKMSGMSISSLASLLLLIGYSVFENTLESTFIEEPSPKELFGGGRMEED